MNILKIFLIFITGILITTLNAGEKSSDPVVHKFQGKMAYAQTQYASDVKKIKYAMQKDYQALLKEKIAKDDLEAASEIKKKIEYLKGKSDDDSAMDVDFDPPGTVLDSLFINGKNDNVALAENGGKVISKVSTPEQLIDGNTTEYTGQEGFGTASFPCNFDFEFKKKYRISYIQFLLWDGGDRFYRYTVETSEDGQEWKPLINRSKGEWRSWQQISFKPRRIKYVRIKGLYNSANKGFYIVEFEAYPYKPFKVPKPKYKSTKK